MKLSKRDRLYHKAEKAARKLNGDFLFDGHALQGLEPVWFVRTSPEECSAAALKMAQDFGCQIVAEMSTMAFPGSTQVWMRVWVDKKFAPALKALYGGKK